VDHGLARLRPGLVVPDHPAVLPEPGERPLDHPPRGWTRNPAGALWVRVLLAPMAHWTRTAQTQAEVRASILDWLYESLPRPPHRGRDWRRCRPAVPTRVAAERRWKTVARRQSHTSKRITCSGSDPRRLTHARPPQTHFPPVHAGGSRSHRSSGLPPPSPSTRPPRVPQKRHERLPPPFRVRSWQVPHASYQAEVAADRRGVPRRPELRPGLTEPEIRAAEERLLNLPA
jgi:hypothetical protein